MNADESAADICKYLKIWPGTYKFIIFFKVVFGRDLL